MAVIPGFTFVATAIAVECCGFSPYLVDVRADDWQIDPDALAATLPRRVGLVVPVASFGRPVAQKEWLRFQRRTGVKVVVDGAASFEAVSTDSKRYLGQIPVALSFHATKSFATAEGGCVVTTDRALSRRTTQALNFGFYGSRRSELASVNGKMSEYHAAVGLAEMDGWRRKRQFLAAVAERYGRRLQAAGLADRLIVTPTVASCYVLFRCADRAEALRVGRSLARSNVEFRFWYGRGLLEHPYFSRTRHDRLETTEALASTIIGLPAAIDLSRAAIERVVLAIGRAIESRT